MLKKRIIPIQLLSEGRLVKTKQFGPARDVGDPVASSRVYSAQQADELVFLNINRDARSIAPMVELLDRVSEVVFMPLALGGGITSFADAETLLRHGADKVVLDSIAYREPALITKIADRFGAQAVVVCLDVRREGGAPDGAPALFSDCGRVRESVPLSEHVRRVVDAGAGEILLQSIDRDGTMTGYDVPLLAEVSEGCPIPVIGAGGAGTYEHMRDAFTGSRVSALACGSLFNFGDNNPIRAKAFLSNYGLKFKIV